MEHEEVQPAGAGAPANEHGASFASRGRARRRARFLRKARELAYRDLGGLVFNLHRFGQRNDELVLAKLTTLGRIDAELRAIEAALGEHEPFTVLREAGVTACARCAAIHSSEDHFCPNCGLALGPHAERPAELRGAAPVHAPATHAEPPAESAPPTPAPPTPAEPAREPAPADATPEPPSADDASPELAAVDATPAEAGVAQAMPAAADATSQPATPEPAATANEADAAPVEEPAASPASKPGRGARATTGRSPSAPSKRRAAEGELEEDATVIIRPSAPGA